MAFALKSDGTKINSRECIQFRVYTDRPMSFIVHTRTHLSAITSKTVTTSADWVRFQLLARKWQRDTGHLSSISAICMDISYQKIIGMGAPAVPFIIRCLQLEGDNPQYWFWALKILTDSDPVPVSDRGNIIKMAQHWIGWAKSENVYHTSGSKIKIS